MRAVRGLPLGFVRGRGRRRDHAESAQFAREHIAVFNRRRGAPCDRNGSIGWAASPKKGHAAFAPVRQGITVKQPPFEATLDALKQCTRRLRCAFGNAASMSSRRPSTDQATLHPLIGFRDDHEIDQRTAAYEIRHDVAASAHPVVHDGLGDGFSGSALIGTSARQHILPVKRTLCFLP